MPELPEVETTRRGIAPYLLAQRIEALWVREARLRWVVAPELATQLQGQEVLAVVRRAKYLLIQVATGWLMVHLGMSGSLRVVSTDQPPGRHDHIDLLLSSGQLLRYTDPRRFGAWLWTEAPHTHPLLSGLGPEPLGPEFDGERLFALSRRRRVAVKPFIMDNAVVVGVGNIYASEALFAAGIDPRRAAGRISLARYQRLAQEIRQVLSQAIECGGTTLKDFVGGDGQPGYFAQQLWVYGRGGQPCRACGRPLQSVRLGQRASVYCAHCQH